MYKLTYFKATNIAGFKSGLGRKTFELDLKTLINKNFIVIIGDNATGKSTFESLIHPFHTATNKKSKIVIEGKEGTIVKEYMGDNGIMIITKAVYSPSVNGGHTSKLFFKIAQGDYEEELNPNGNVTSYYELVKRYFGITKDYVNFASYNDVVKGIVDMTDTERKLNVSSLIPNTSRFEITHNIVNEKYKYLRNIMRNISQKICQLRDEESLTADIKRIEMQLNSVSKEREILIKKNAKYDGRIKEIAGNSNVNELITSYKKTNNDIVSLSSALFRKEKEIILLLRNYGIDYSDITTNVNDILLNENNIRDKMTTAKYSMDISHDKLKELKSKLSDIENELEEFESSVYAITYQSIDELYSLKKTYERRLLEMTYNKNLAKYENMSYDESLSFMNTIEMINTMVDGLYDRYGNLFTLHYSNPETFKNLDNDRDLCIKHIQELTPQIESAYNSIMDKNQYRGLKDILEKRPKNCIDDSCPFIANALKWKNIDSEIETLKTAYSSMVNEKDMLVSKLHEYDMMKSLLVDAASLDNIINSSANLFMKYFNITVDEIRKGFANDNISNIFNLEDIKYIAAILSEKDLYNDIVRVKLPDIDKNIELCKNSEKSRDLLDRSIAKLTAEAKDLKHQISWIIMQSKIATTFYDKYNDKYNTMCDVKILYTEYCTNKKDFDELSSSASDIETSISNIKDMLNKIEYNEKEIKRYDKIMAELVPTRDRLKFSINQLMALKVDKAVVERDFMVVDIMKKIIQPGKGIWKEAIDIYMHDINEVANQLLLNTFGGNLCLKDFQIDDKSFIIPYTFNGVDGEDISIASSSQRSTISTAISLAIISKLIDNYGVITYDEADKDLSPANKEIFVNTIAQQSRFIGINQSFIVTHSPEYYEPYDVGYVLFPGYKLNNKKNKDYIEI